MTVDDIEQFILQWIADHKGLSVNELDVDTHFFQAGWIDSLGMFRLIFDLETHFDCQLEQNQLFCAAQPTIRSFALQVMRQLTPSN